MTTQHSVEAIKTAEALAAKYNLTTPQVLLVKDAFWGANEEVELEFFSLFPGMIGGSGLDEWLTNAASLSSAQWKELESVTVVSLSS